MIINKITTGHVVQSFDARKGVFVSQNFVAGDQVDYEDENGNPESSSPLEIHQGHDDGVMIEEYLSFDMVQPITKENDIYWKGAIDALTAQGMNIVQINNAIIGMGCNHDTADTMCDLE